MECESYFVYSNFQIQFGIFQTIFRFLPEVVNELVERTNINHGSRHPVVRNVYTTHGEYDPWSALGVLEDINEDSPVVILPGETHCSDLNSISEFDTPEMRASKERLFELIKKWLGIL
jgi:hypothetical protein